MVTGRAAPAFANKGFSNDRQDMVIIGPSSRITLARAIQYVVG